MCNFFFGIITFLYHLVFAAIGDSTLVQAWLLLLLVPQILANQNTRNFFY